MRPDWNTYFMELAQQVATRSTCDRANVGCLLVKDRQVISTGYNGSMAGHEHCDGPGGHLLVNGSCQRALHAEENSIASAAKRGAAVDNATAYITHFPCWRCFRQLANAGITKIYFNEMKINKMSKPIFDEMLRSKIEIFSMKNETLQSLAADITLLIS